MEVTASFARAFHVLNSDARHWQILALSSLFCLSRFISDFGASFIGLAAALSGAMLAQLLGSRATNTAFQWKSAAITALGISILLRASNPGFWFAAAFIGIAAKFLLRSNNKHVFNPACIGIALVTLVSAGAWVSPGQWGQMPIVAAFVIGFAALVLSSARRVDIALGFLCFFGLLLFWRAFYLGDPLSIPLHQIQNGALLVFAFFMITDPRSTPDTRLGRLMFAASVAAFAAWLSWGPHVRGAAIYALAALAPLTLIIDRYLPAKKFEWPEKLSMKVEHNEPKKHLSGRNVPYVARS